MARVVVVVLALVGTLGVLGTDAAAELSALDRLLARTDAVSREVAKIRGLRLKRPIPYEVVDHDELRRRVVALATEAKAHAETMAEGLALGRWGMIPLALDYPALLMDLRTEQIAGYYDPDTKRLTISRTAGDDPVQAELVLAHEIDHGLQDQAFDLKKFAEVSPGEDDAAIARRALVEGDGIALMIEVMLARQGHRAPWSNPGVATALDKGMTIPGNGDGLDLAPLAVREAMIFPYRAGVSFVAALRRRQPWSAVDAAFARPPTSTEQVLHPERYLAGDEPVRVELSPPSTPGFTLAHTTVWGELGFGLFLRSHGIDPSAVTLAAEGWGGDRVIVMTRDDDPRPQRAIGIARLEWDSEPDAIEAAEAAVKALDRAVVGATIDTSHTRTRWFAVDGTMTWLERRGPSIVIVIGAPAWAAAALAVDVWASSVVHPAAPAPPAQRRRR